MLIITIKFEIHLTSYCANSWAIEWAVETKEPTNLPGLWILGRQYSYNTKGSETRKLSFKVIRQKPLVFS